MYYKLQSQKYNVSFAQLNANENGEKLVPFATVGDTEYCH
jgi:hypothetical protein